MMWYSSRVLKCFRSGLKFCLNSDMFITSDLNLINKCRQIVRDMSLNMAGTGHGKLLCRSFLFFWILATASGNFRLCDFGGVIEEDYEGIVGDIAISVDIEGSPKYYEPDQFYESEYQLYLAFLQVMVSRKSLMQLGPSYFLVWWNCCFPLGIGWMGGEGGEGCEGCQTAMYHTW